MNRLTNGLFVLTALALLACPVLRAESDVEWRAKIEQELRSLREENLKMKRENLGLQKKVDAAAAERKEISTSNAVDGVYYRAMGAATATAAYLDYDRPDIKGWGLTFTGEYLYSKVQKGETTFAYRNDTNTAPFFNGGLGDMLGSAENTELDWSHGFRLGLGYRLPYDGWEIGVSYTRVEADSDRSARADTTGGNSYLITPFLETRAALAQARQDFDYNVVNLELSRKSKISKTLSLRVFGGPSIVWLDDEDIFQYWGDAVFGTFPGFDGVNRGGYYKRTADTTLYGIRAGADGNFKLGHGVSLYGKAAASLLTGEQEHTTFHAVDAAGAGAGTFQSTEIFQNAKTEFDLIVPAVEVEAGVDYDWKINDSFNLKLAAGYQFTQYFNVLERTTAFPTVGDPSNQITRTKSDLGLHGLVFRVRLDF